MSVRGYEKGNTTSEEQFLKAVTIAKVIIEEELKQEKNIEREGKGI